MSPSKTQLIRTLNGTAPEPEVLVDNQDVNDIIDGIKVKHRECEDQYDAIAGYFEKGTMDDILFSLWKFCKDNLKYMEEGTDKQHLSAPVTLLKRGYSDCKCYALFIGGVLDALKRKGYDIEWQYRFVPSSLLEFGLGHVFVVVSQVDGEDTSVWIDPVMNGFDQHFFYFIKRDEKISGVSGIGRLSGMSVLPHGELVSQRIGAAASSYYYIQGGQPFAYDQTVRSNGLTADEMGLPYAMLLLSRGYDAAHPGTADAWWANPPVTFWYNGAPYALPPPVTTAGTEVPLIPLGLQVRYAQNFGGYQIPANFFYPVVVPGQPGGQNKLQLGNDTAAISTPTGSLALILIEAAMGPLINSFSSYPYATNFNSTNDLDHKLIANRNTDDFLQPTVSKTVLQTVAPVAEELLSFIPVVGTAASGVVKAAAVQTGGANTSVVDPTLSNNTQGGGLFSSGPGGSLLSNPWVIGGVILGIALLLYSLNSDK